MPFGLAQTEYNVQILEYDLLPLEADHMNAYNENCTMKVICDHQMAPKTK